MFFWNNFCRPDTYYNMLLRTVIQLKNLELLQTVSSIEKLNDNTIMFRR